MTVATLQQTLAIEGVQSIVLTETQTDEDSGDFVREIRITGAGNLPVLTVRVASSEREKINFTAPVQTF